MLGLLRSTILKTDSTSSALHLATQGYAADRRRNMKKPQVAQTDSKSIFWAPFYVGQISSGFGRQANTTMVCHREEYCPGRGGLSTILAQTKPVWSALCGY